MKAVNIHWDVDYDENGYLPTEVDIPEEVANIHSEKYDAEEKISEWLTDTYGCCHGGFIVKLTEAERNEYCKNCAPCSNEIENGRCDALVKLFNGTKEDEK